MVHLSAWRGCASPNHSSGVSTEPPRCRAQARTQPVQCAVVTAEPNIIARAEQGRWKRRLVMMRHAHSEERLTNLRDHDRPITQAGRASAREVAEKLAAHGFVPELIVSSDSTRTRQTLDVMAEAVPSFGAAEACFRGSLYTVAALDGQTRRHLQELIAEETAKRKDDVACVLCVGHNKGMEEAASHLAGQRIRLETANAALLEGTADNWEEAFAEDSLWKLVELVVPDTVPEE